MQNTYRNNWTSPALKQREFRPKSEVGGFRSTIISEDESYLPNKIKTALENHQLGAQSNVSGYMSNAQKTSMFMNRRAQRSKNSQRLLSYTPIKKTSFQLNEASRIVRHQAALFVSQSTTTSVAGSFVNLKASNTGQQFNVQPLGLRGMNSRQSNLHSPFKQTHTSQAYSNSYEQGLTSHSYNVGKKVSYNGAPTPPFAQGEYGLIGQSEVQIQGLHQQRQSGTSSKA